MPFINDEVFDQGLDYADANGTRVDLCSQEPTTYTEATDTFSLCNKTGLNVGAPQDDAASPSDGRVVVVPAITDGDVTDTGTATHWALTNGTDTLIATGALLSSKAFTSGNKFQLDAIEIAIRDAVASVGGGGGGSTLRTGMESYWNLDEASGTRADSHGSNDLTEGFATVNSRTGIGGAGTAADMPGGGTGGMLLVADNASISIGDISWSLVFWVVLDATLPTGFTQIVRKGSGTGYRIYFLGTGSGNAFGFQIFDATSGDNSVTASTFGAPSAGTFYMIACVVDDVGNEVRISVNAGTQDTVTKTVTMGDIASNFEVPNVDRDMNGGYQFMGFWKKALTTDEITELYNSGAGLNYAGTE